MIFISPLVGRRTSVHRRVLALFAGRIGLRRTLPPVGFVLLAAASAPARRGIVGAGGAARMVGRILVGRRASVHRRVFALFAGRIGLRQMRLCPGLLFLRLVCAATDCKENDRHARENYFLHFGIHSLMV